MPKLVKSAFQKVKFTNAQIQELKNCANDPVYMLQNFAHVLHPTKGEIPFHLFEYQKEMVSAFHQYRNIVILSGRQLGKTECAVGYLLWYAMFKPGSTILVAANNYRQALEIMKRIRFIYESLPDHIRAGSKYYAIERIEFDNGSTIEAQATTENTGRGKSISVLYLDEFDFVPINIATDFWTSISATLSTGGQCIITSTPNNSDGPFAQIWRAANDNLDEYGNLRASKIGKNGFFALEFPWHRHPDRDEKWAEEQRAKLGEDRFLREHCCCVQSTIISLSDCNSNIFDITMGELFNLL